MLAPYWLSLLRNTCARKNRPPETELNLLRKNLAAAAANASSLGANPHFDGETISPLLEMLDVVHVELRKIESGTALLNQRAAEANRSARAVRQRKNTDSETAAVKIARRLVERGVPVAEAARKTLLPESVVKKLLAPEQDPVRQAPPPVIERSQHLL